MPILNGLFSSVSEKDLFEILSADAELVALRRLGQKGSPLVISTFVPMKS